MEDNQNNPINQDSPRPERHEGENTPKENQAGEGQNPQQQRKKTYPPRRRWNRYSSSNRRSDAPAKKARFKKASVVVPLYNEEESLRPLFNEIKKGFAALNYNIDYEVIFVDDGSTDKSLEIIKELARQDAKVKFISFRKNYGKSAALQTGFKEVTGDVVITMDADLQDDPMEIGNLLSKLEDGLDLVSGWKKKRHDPFIKKHTSKIFNFITRKMSGLKIHDLNCGLKAYKREVIQNIRIYGELHRYIPVLADWQGFKVGEIVVKHHPRRYGKTKFGISRFFKGFVDLLTVMFITRYIKRPMHLFGFLGAVTFLAGFLVSLYLSIAWINGMSLSNRPMLFLGMLLMIVGAQFFAVGLLGEIMVHNFQDDSEYTVKDKK